MGSMGSVKEGRKLGPLLMACAGALVLAAVVYAVFGAGADATASHSGKGAMERLETTPRAIGKSGLPLPRFVSLKNDRVNVRRGPSGEHGVSWVFTRRGVPVEIIAEYEHWRRVRDAEGEEGWVYQSLLSGRRTITVAPWRRDERLAMHDGPSAQSTKVAYVRGGVQGTVDTCNGEWCRIEVGGYEGWIEQPMLWGVYPHERLD